MRFSFPGLYLSWISVVLMTANLLILTPIILKNLGSTLYGAWIFINSLSTFLILMDLGFHTGMARYTAHFFSQGQQQKLKSLIASVFQILFAVSVVLLVLGFLFSYFLPDLLKLPPQYSAQTKTAFLIILLSVLVVLLGGIFENTLYGLNQIKAVKILAIGKLLCYFALVMIAIQQDLGIVGLALAVLLSNVGLYAGYVWFVQKQSLVSLGLKTVDLPLVREIGPYSLNNFMLNLTSIIIYHIDTIVIALVIGLNAVAPYDIAFKLTFVAPILVFQILYVIFPELTRLYSVQEIQRLKSLYLLMTRVSLAFILPTVIALLYFGHGFVVLWAGEENWVGFPVFLLFLLMTVYHAIASPPGVILKSIGQNKEFMISEVINALLNLVLSVFLAFKLGVLGVILGTIVAHTVTSTWFIPFLACRHLKISVREYFAQAIRPPLMAGLVVFLLFIPWGFSTQMVKFSYLSMVFNIILVFCAYFLVFLRFFALKNDRDFFAKLLNNQKELYSQGIQP